MNKDVTIILGRILKDMSVDLMDEFDQNFEREGFFSESWQRRKSPVNSDNPILSGKGDLRRSIQSRTTAESIIFYTTLPYAAIHNDGGEIVVTTRMKRFFWAKYYEATGAFGRKKNGGLRENKKNTRLSTEADFWKAMALQKTGSTMKIPRRRFLGVSPEVEKIVRDIIEENITSYFEHDYNILKK